MLAGKHALPAALLPCNLKTAPEALADASGHDVRLSAALLEEPPASYEPHLVDGHGAARACWEHS